MDNKRLLTDEETECTLKALWIGDLKADHIDGIRAVVKAQDAKTRAETLKEVWSVLCEWHNPYNTRGGLISSYKYTAYGKAIQDVISWVKDGMGDAEIS